MSIHQATPEHEILYRELVELVTRHTVNMPPIEILAIAANMVGKLIAMQDQRATSRDQAMDVVIKNLEEGNRQALEQLHNTKGNA